MPFIVDKDKFIARLSNDPTTSFTVYFYGATVTSWMVNGQEQLFLSNYALLNGTKAIRGGIPIVFPQFGTIDGSKLPQHGFARCSYWKLTKYMESNDQICVTFSLSHDDINSSFHDLWNYKFQLDYIIVLTGSDGNLSNTLRVTNMDEREFNFTWLLHTYIRVPSLIGMEIIGLDGISYSDKTRNKTNFTQSGPIIVTEEVDRIFANVLPVSNPIFIHVNKERWLSVERSSSSTQEYKGFSDIVIWNPWEKNAKAMTDFGDEEYHHMICVETGDVAHNVSILPGHSRESGQVLHAFNATGSKL